MKKIYIVLSLILILTFRYYYEHEDKMLDKALIYAKENRNELKKVLKYYKNDKADTPNTLQPVNGMNDFLFLQVDSIKLPPIIHTFGKRYYICK